MVDLTELTLDGLSIGQSVSTIPRGTAGWTQHKKLYILEKAEEPAIAIDLTEGKTYYRLRSNESLYKIFSSVLTRDSRVVRISGRRLRFRDEIICQVGRDWSAFYENLNTLGFSLSGNESSRRGWTNRRGITIFFDGPLVSLIELDASV